MDGFLAPRPFRPATLGFIVLGHAALLTAVILAKGPQVFQPARPTVIFTPIDNTPPPPTPPEPPRPADPSPREASRPAPTPETSRPLDPTPTFPTTFPKVDPLPGPVVDPVPPAPPLPPERTIVETEAKADPRAEFQPAYPPSLQRAEVEGKAVVRVLIGTDGRVHSVEIVSADDPAFGEATRRQALRAWRFKPALRDGVAVESWRTMTVHFRLQA